jgi:16S rRNA A1518/A1519 N6-dimethyltransferase RsmA/KsgA/DIM1 with predicted DNA glycosylase/AP lyase activity
MAAYDTELLQRIGPNVFWPKPRVNSRLVRFTPAIRARDLPEFAAFARVLFARPKKTVVNSFVEGLSHPTSAAGTTNKDNLRDIVTSALHILDIDPRIRPGKLDFSQIKSLYKKLVPEILA